MTKKTFLEWTKKGNKGLSISDLLREFEKRYNEVLVRDRELLQSKNVDLFVGSTNKSFPRGSCKFNRPRIQLVGGTRGMPSSPEEGVENGG